MTLQEGFEKMAETAEKTGVELNTLTGRVEGSMAVLATTGKNAASAAEDIESIGTASGAADKAFKIMVESNANQLKILNNNLKAKMKEYGDILVIAMGGAAQMINEKMRENSEKRAAANLASIKREITIIESELRTINNPIDTFFRGKEKTQRIEADFKSRLEELKKEAILANEAIESLKQTGDGDGDEDPILPTDPVEFEKQLNASKKAYDEYLMLVKNGFKKEADLFYATQLDLGNNYKSYLKNQLELYKNDFVARKILLLEYAAIVEQEREDSKKAEEELFEASIKRVEAFNKFVASTNVQASDRLKPEAKTKDGKTQNAITDDMGKKLLATLTHLNKVQTESERIERQWEGIIQDITDPNNWSKASSTFLGLANIIGDVNRDLGDTVYHLSGVVDGIGALLSGSGDPTAIFMGISQSVSALANSLIDMAFKVPDITETIKKFNKELVEQQRILDRSSRKGDGQEAYAQQLALLQKQKADLENQKNDILKRSKELAAAGLGLSAFGIIGFIAWKKKMDEIKEAMKQVNEEIEGTDVLIQELSQAWTDFTAGLVTEIDLADKIAEAFEEGKTSAKDFADFANDVMKDAVLEVFKASVLGPELTKAQEYLAKALEDSVLSEQEVKIFQDMFAEAGEKARVTYDALFGNLPQDQDAGEDKNSLSGSIRASLTEETGSILAGSINAIRLDNREMLIAQLSMVDHLRSIDLNTFKLHSIDTNIQELKNSISNIVR